MTNTITKIIPRGEQVLVKPKTDTRSENEYGLSIPDTVDKEQKAIGVIVRVGEKVHGLKPKQTVIYGAFVGERIKIKEHDKEVEYLLVLDEEILAFIE